jgi:crossover junction endodeoxyribonuclease RuvC
MVILGVDPGLAHTGWGVVETRGSVCRARAYGCVATKAHEAIDSRLGRIYDELRAVIDKFGPTELAIENVYFGENVKSAVATAQARGVAIVACAKAGLTVGEYTPMQIKQAVVGTGAADKRQVMYMVKSILALDHEPHPDHAADALAAAVCHANLRRTIALTDSRRTLQ